jgi:hyperosmotically inducible periplasmic protein
MIRRTILLSAFVALATLTGCSGASSKSPDVSNNIRRSLDQANLKDVSVSQDRNKGVVTLGGHVASDAEKSQADSIAKSEAGSQVVANEVAVINPDAKADSKTVNADLDKGIEKNLDAALLQARINKGIRYSVKNGVVTLTGNVNSENRRVKAEAIASRVPNVQQVVNELELKNQKATATN